MLEIMKDSRVGAYGAMSFALLMLVKYSFYLDIPLYALPMASLVMPIAGRWCGSASWHTIPMFVRKAWGKALDSMPGADRFGRAYC